MCYTCTRAPLSQRHNNFSYFYRRRFSNDTDRRNFYVGLLDEIAGCDLELAEKLSSYIANIHERYHDRLVQWLQHPLERLKLKEAFRYFLAECSAKGIAAAHILHKLTHNLPLTLVSELIECTRDLHDDNHQYLTSLRRRSYGSVHTLSRLETTV